MSKDYIQLDSDWMKREASRNHCYYLNTGKRRKSILEPLAWANLDTSNSCMDLDTGGDAKINE